MARRLHAADLFCGAGGTSIGAEQSGAASVRFAVNHWDVAVDTHSANFPHAKHINSRLDQVAPGECPKIDLLFASPECTHHSRARGGRPTSDQQRAGAWELLPWLNYHRPSFLVVENVVEFAEWGPVGDNGRPLQRFKGRLFDAWLSAIKAEGYTVDYARLNAADFGAATSRERLFVVARKGNRSPRFPEPTHAKKPGRALPGMQWLPWRAAAEIIDWSVPCPSIFSRVRPLADKTLARIEAGLRRFVEPCVVTLRSTTGPMGSGGTLTTGRNHGIAVPFQYQLIGLGAGRSRRIGEPVPTMLATRENHGVAVPYIAFAKHGDLRTADLQKPLGTITGKNGVGVAVPYICGCGARDGQSPPTSPDVPLNTIVTKDAKCIVAPFLSSFYGNGDGSAVASPCPTIVTKDRHSLVMAIIDPCCLNWPDPHSEAMASLQRTMLELGVADIGFRMLQNHELSAAQGFPDTYVFRGNKSQVTRQIGNSVSPPVARAITEAVAA